MLAGFHHIVYCTVHIYSYDPSGYRLKTQSTPLYTGHSWVQAPTPGPHKRPNRPSIRTSCLLPARLYFYMYTTHRRTILRTVYIVAIRKNTVQLIFYLQFSDLQLSLKELRYLCNNPWFKVKNKITSTQGFTVQVSLKGTVPRDFWPPFFVIIRTCLSHWPTG